MVVEKIRKLVPWSRGITWNIQRLKISGRLRVYRQWLYLGRELRCMGEQRSRWHEVRFGLVACMWAQIVVNPTSYWASSLGRVRPIISSPEHIGNAYIKNTDEIKHKLYCFPCTTFSSIINKMKSRLTLLVWLLWFLWVNYFRIYSTWKGKFWFSIYLNTENVAGPKKYTEIVGSVSSLEKDWGFI